jgi:HEAT repeat protein
MWNHFSDLLSSDIRLLKEKWNLVSSVRKVTLLQDLASLMDYDFQVNFDALGKFCMNDDEPLVRANAIRLLFEYDHKDMIDPMLDVLNNDADEEVQAMAATMLGNYVYKGELDELKNADKKRVEDALLHMIDDSNAVILQRRALEAVAYSSREEVNPLILAAYEKVEKEWKATALFAMGRSANQQWEKYILRNLDSDEPDILFEAIGAAGEMYLESALPKLTEIAEQGEELDQLIRMAIARALENIGGIESISILNKMLEWAEDDEEVDLIEQAIEYASFTNAVKMPDMFGFAMDEMDDAIDEFVHDHDEDEDD